MICKKILFAASLCSGFSSVLVFAADYAPLVAPGPAFDVAIRAVIANDNMSYGVTNTDHGVYGSININPTYDIFYANIFFENLKYTNISDAGLINSQLKFQVGATPTWGDLSLDMNVQRRTKLNSPNRYVTVPYVTGTYKFSEQFSASLGGGYYFYDNNSVYPNTAEIYGAIDLKPVSWLALHGESSYDLNGPYEAFPAGVPPAVPLGTSTKPYLEAIGSVTVALPSNISVSGKLGYEAFNGNAVWPNYTWFDVGADYAVNDHIGLGVHYHGNFMGTGSVECSAQSWNFDCDNRILASLTLGGKLSDLRQ